MNTRFVNNLLVLLMVLGLNVSLATTKAIPDAAPEPMPVYCAADVSLRCSAQRMPRVMPVLDCSKP